MPEDLLDHLFFFDKGDGSHLPVVLGEVRGLAHLFFESTGPIVVGF